MDMNGNELLIISRDQVTRVFGPPVEPISLTLDPSGKCLLSIPFRPVQHVPITKSKVGHLELKSLHDLLQMVAGKGFCFCPGIPAKFLAGRACGKFVAMHRTPFRRFNAMGCPIYFKFPKSIDSDKFGQQLPIRTLCPRCRQVAKWAQTLPVLQNTVPRPSVINPTPVNQILNQVPADNKSVVLKNLNTPVENKSLTNSNQNTVKQDVLPSGALPLTILDGSKFDGNNSSISSRTSAVGKSLQKSDGNSVDLSSKRRGLTNEKLQAVSDSLRQLLKQRSGMRDGLTDITAKMEGGAQSRGGEKSPGSSRPRSPRGVKSRKNVCRICQKQFSSHLKLSKHVQRHEGSAPNLSQVLRRKIRRRKSSAAVLNRLFKGFSAHSSNMKRKNSAVSEWSLQLMLNCLDDLLSNEKKHKVDTGITSKVKPEKKRNKGKRKAEEPPRCVENPSIRPSLHRSGSGLAAVQTLLSAAQLADDDDLKVNNIGNDHFSPQNGLAPETSGIDHPAKRDSDSPSHAKKARQSVRLASKRAGKKSKHGTNATVVKEGINLPSRDNTPNAGHPSDEALTNLNLLSTVILQAEMSDTRGSPGLQLLSSASNTVERKVNSTAHIIPKDNELHLFFKSPPVDLVQKAPFGQRANNLHQIPTTVMSKEDARASKNKNTELPPIIPLALNSDSKIMNPSPHSSTNSSPLVPVPPPVACAFPILQQLHKNITKGHGSTMASSKNSLPGECIPGSNCGAMDLSKPKSLHTVADTSSSGKASPAPASQDSADVLRHLMMINPVSLSQKPMAVQPEPNQDPRIRLLSSKEADDSLQARMFASAKNYKVDPSKLMATGHHNAVVTCSQIPTSAIPAKQGKGKEKLNLPAPLSDKSEIQCGYKWSGSGGLVKEKTQLFRELVPSVVMANILNGPVSSSALPKMDDPISAPMQNVTKSKAPDKQQQELQVLAKSSQISVPMTSSQIPVPMTGKSSQSANHITLKPREAPVRPKTPQYVLNLSKNRNDQEIQPAIPASVHVHSKPSPISFPSSGLKTSLLNTPSVLIPTSIFAQKPPIQNSLSISGSVNKKLSANTSVLAPLRNTVLATLPSPILPSGQQPPNSTLATILRHPLKLGGSSSFSKAPEVSFSVTVSCTGAINTTAKTNTVERVTEIKTEPLEIDDTGDKRPTIISDTFGNATFVKIENRESQSPSSRDDRDLSTPPNLVVDMGSEKNQTIVLGKPNPLKSNGEGSNKSSARGKVSLVNSPLKCEFCSQVFRTNRGQEYHMCPKKPR